MRKLVCWMLCILLMLPMSLSAFATEETPDCTHSWSEVTVPASCLTPGSVTKTCSACGTSTTETIPATGHSFGSWTYDNTGHSRECSVCHTIESGSHSWGDGQVTTQASCTTTGVRAYTCVCGASRTEEIPTSDHPFGDWDLTQTDHSRTCSACGKVESGKHVWDGGSITVPATCLEEGAKAYACTGCDGFLVEVIPKLTTHTYDNSCDADCNVCGVTRDAGHVFSALWSKNSSGHWHACNRCGEKADIGDHYPGPAATEEKAQLCLTCGYTMTPMLNHTHTYATKWEADETGHWYACEGCGDQKDFESHSYDDLCDPDCNVCGHLAATAHYYDGTWLSDETGHWAICGLCEEASPVEAHTPGPEATETEAQLCSVCSFELAPALEHVHEAKDSWLTDEELHWKECECGEKLDEAAHSWDEGTENKDSTVTYVCTTCQAQRTEGEPKAQSSSFPWMLVLIVLVVALIGAVVALILVLRPSKKNGKFKK